MWSRVLLPVLVALGLLAPACQRTETPPAARRAAVGVADVVVQLRTNSGRHWVVAEDAGGTEGVFTGIGRWRRPTGLARADRTSPQGWETFPVRSCEPGIVGFQAPNGAWLSAQPDGTLVFNRHREEPYCPGAWEAFRVEQTSADAVAFVTYHGTYVRAPGQGGGELRHDPRERVDVDETFWPSAPMRGPPPPPPPPPSSGLVGQVRVEAAGGFVDDQGPVLPILCHFGDALSRWTRGQQAAVLADLDRIKAAGFDGIRFWTTLGLDDREGGFWVGRAVGPTYVEGRPQRQGDTNLYWLHLEAFLEALRDRGLVAQVSQGDVRPVAIPDRQAFAHQLADIVNRVGPHVVLLAEAANESRDTGEPDAGALARFSTWFHDRAPQALIGLSAYTGTEDVAILNAFSRTPAHLYIVHSYRGGRWWDKVRHIFSLPYEHGARSAALRLLTSAPRPDIEADIAASRARTLREWADYLERYFPERQEHARLRASASARVTVTASELRLAKRVGWNGEGPGFGDRVSAIDNKHEIDAAAYQLLAAQALLSRQGYVWFSGPGVISDDPGGERLEAMPGFWEVAQVKTWLPADVMRYDELYHGGDTWRDKRAFAAVGETRADHAGYRDGRRCIVIYGPEPHAVQQVRAGSITHDHTNAKGRVVCGNFN